METYQGCTNCCKMYVKKCINCTLQYSNILPGPFPVNGAYCTEKGADADLGDAQDSLMRCGQSLPLSVGGHSGGLYPQSLHCDRPTPDLLLQDGPHRDTR